LQVFLGGVAAQVLYAGRSQFPGLDQIVLTIPGNAPPGCYVSVVVVASQITPSNFATIPIAAGGRTCSDAASPVTPQQYQTILSQAPAKVGVLTLLQSFGAVAGSAAIGTFQQVSGYGASVGYGSVSVGSCLVTNSVSAPATTLAGLDAGASLALTGPSGVMTLNRFTASGAGPGTYASSLSTGFIPSAGGAFTFDNGTGGADVGHLSATLDFPGSFTWTNPAQAASIVDTLGLNVAWSGGAGGGLVGISGSVGATLAGNRNASVSFTCYAPLAAGAFTVPPAVLLALPSGNGTLTVGVLTNPRQFTAPGLDFGAAIGGIAYTQAIASNSTRR
jgi:hypothetical protein